MKVARTVLRGRGGGNAVLLPDYLADYGSPREARQGLGRYLIFYNTERSHQALDYRRPAEWYHA
jgi:transposase InsO family protein